MNFSPYFGKFLILLIVFSIFQPWHPVEASDQKGMNVIINQSRGRRLLIWCPWADDPIRGRFMTVAAIKFQKRTGARLEIFMKSKNDLQKKLAVDWGRKKSSPDISYIDPGFKQRPIGASLLELNNLSFSPGRDPFWKLGDAGGGSKNYLPIEGHATAIFYNKILFIKAGIKLPNGRLLNADEFLFCDTLSFTKSSAKWQIRGRVGVLDWFNVPEGKGNNTFGHTYGAGYGVNRHSRHVGLAKQFLQFLITPQAAQLWTRYVQSPYPIPLHIWPSDSIYDELAVQRTNQAQMEGVDHLHFQKATLNNLWPEMTRDFICGRISVDDFVRRMNSKF